ncbi:pseudouridine synthase [Candidatus Palauibacter sp.]|uniref:pseudouridine synthase n=1 Tax=Candidatus Palauibacter sp. TaxID=3101350 RepID=UPI003B5C70D0
MRLQKFLSRAGVASRRKSEELIVAGRVRVNGSVVTLLGSKVDPRTDRVEVDGRRVRPAATQWLALHKPPGVACTRRDPSGRPTIYELLPAGMHHLPHVGRLDFLSEGLLLLSNQGDVVHRLLHPSTELPRVYRVELLGPVSGDLPRRLRGGVPLEDGPARARDARWIGDPATASPAVEMVLTEGRNREVRRMLARLEIRIRRLCRTSFGPIELGELAAGESRALSGAERAALERAVGMRRGGSGPGR